MSTTAEPDYGHLARISEPISRFAQIYHHLDIEGLDHFPREGPVLVLSTHSMFSYDLILGILEIHRRTGRLIRGLGDDFFWRVVPPVGKWFNAIGIVPASPGAAQELLERGEVVGLCPGGQWEALKPSTERFQLRWKSRRGFARLALQTGVPIVLTTCPGADLLLTVYPSRITDEVYRRWHFPLPIVRGWGPTLFPRRVDLRIHLTEPFMPPKPAGEQPSDDECDAFRDLVTERMREWVRHCVARDGYVTG